MTKGRKIGDIALTAAEAGKMVRCEKPLAMSGKEAEPMVQAGEKAGVIDPVSFNCGQISGMVLPYASLIP